MDYVLCSVCSVYSVFTGYLKSSLHKLYATHIWFVFNYSMWLTRHPQSNIHVSFHFQTAITQNEPQSIWGFCSGETMLFPFIRLYQHQLQHWVKVWHINKKGFSDHIQHACSELRAHLQITNMRIFSFCPMGKQAIYPTWWVRFSSFFFFCSFGFG